MPDQERPSLPTSLRAFALGAAAEPDYGYGFRYHSRDPKGLGYLGTLQRPDGSGVMGEYSIGVDLGGQRMEIPSMVPTLTRDEVQQILTLKDGQPLPRTIIQKAIAHATQRLAAGLPVFARTGEQQALYPDLVRAPIPDARPQPPPMMPSHLPGGVPLSQVGQSREPR